MENTRQCSKQSKANDSRCCCCSVVVLLCSARAHVDVLGIIYNRENIDPSVQLWHPRNVRCAQHQQHNLNVREKTPCRHENVRTSK